MREDCEGGFCGKVESGRGHKSSNCQRLISWDLADYLLKAQGMAVSRQP